MGKDKVLTDEEIEILYDNDSSFHDLVHTLISTWKTGNFSPEEVRAAVNLSERIWKSRKENYDS